MNVRMPRTTVMRIREIIVLIFFCSCSGWAALEEGCKQPEIQWHLNKSTYAPFNDNGTNIVLTCFLVIVVCIIRIFFQKRRQHEFLGQKNASASLRGTSQNGPTSANPVALFRQFKKHGFSLDLQRLNAQREQVSKSQARLEKEEKSASSQYLPTSECSDNC